MCVFVVTLEEPEDEWLELLELNGQEALFRLDIGVEVTAVPSSMHSVEKTWKTTATMESTIWTRKIQIKY